MHGHVNGHVNGHADGKNGANGHANGPIGLANGAKGANGNGHVHDTALFPSTRTLDGELEPIAVIGMGCRLPGDVSSASDFWSMLLAGRSGQSPRVPSNRFNIDAHYHSRRDRPGSLPVLGGYFLSEDLAPFDAGAFGISPVEAMWMDPQQRKLLEVVYEALESGGATLEGVAGSRTGVWAASFTSDWLQMAGKEPSFRHTMAATGVDPGILSDRISYVFDLRGPSVAVNTACSSSIYALHGAATALRARECDAAVVGGTNLVLTIDQQMNSAKIGVLSPRSTCSTFDEGADGYGRAEGVGAVYLKRLADALRDGDPVRAVLRGSAVNHNGKASTASISYPGMQGQVYVMDEAYRLSGLSPLDTGFVETHGTGTAVGDPIEAEALGTALNRHRRRGVDPPLMIGAVKTNIGHGEAVSGLSALIKAVLVCERGIIPPTIGIKKLTAKIKWDEWQLQVPVQPTPFPAHLPVRRVSCNVCGYGGTNAHVIVEEAAVWLPGGHTPNYTWAGRGVGGAGDHGDRPFLIPFSAADKVSLRKNIEAHAGVVSKYSLHDLAFTLGTRRTRHASRAFSVANTRTLANVFAAPDASFAWADKKHQARRVGFVFTGQGAQWAGMGASLLEHSARSAMDAVLAKLADGPALGGWTLESALRATSNESRVHEAEFAQPLCTAVQIGLTDVLADFGVLPVVTVGHSSGEMAAAHSAGLISAAEAIVAAFYRGQVAKSVREGGAMLAVGLGAEASAEHIAAVGAEGKVVVACHNSPSSSTLSGDADKLDEVRLRLDALGIFARPVKTGGKAYHSHYMAAAADKYEMRYRAARRFVDLSPPAEHTRGVRMVSSVTAKFLQPWAVLDETYWSANLRSPVLFQQAVTHLLEADEFADVDVLVEIGPHPAMAGSVKQIKAELDANRGPQIEHLSSLTRGDDSAASLLRLAGELWARGYEPLNMTAVSGAYVAEKVDVPPPKGRIIVDLPSYQWNYRRLWPESRASKEHRNATHMRHDVLGQLVIGASPSEPTWRNVLRLRDLPWLRDHTLGREVVFPAAGYFSMAIEAVTQLYERSEAEAGRGNLPIGVDSYVLRDVSIQKALVTPDNDDGIEVLTTMRPSIRGRSDGWWDFSVSSVDFFGDGTRREHMAGSVQLRTTPTEAHPRRVPRPVPSFPQRASGRAWNQALRQVGFDYGPTFADMNDVRFDGRTYASSCTTKLKQVVDKSLGESRYVLHPACVDSAMQLSIAAIYAGRTAAMTCGVVPVRCDEVTVWPPTAKQLADGTASAYAWVDQRGLRSFDGSAQVTAADGQMVLELRNVRTTSYEAAVPQSDHAALAPQPYGEMVWDEDIDTLLQGSGLDGRSAVDLASLAVFKYPGAKILVVGDDITPALTVLEKNPHSVLTLALLSAEESVVMAAKEAMEGSFSNASVITLDAEGVLDIQGFADASYDVLLAPSQLFSTLKSLVKTSGFLVASNRKSIEKVGVDSKADDIDEAGYEVALVYRNKPHAIVEHLRETLHALGWHTSVCRLESVQTASTPDLSHVLVLADLEGPLLTTVSEGEYLAIQHLTNTASSLLFVTNGGLLEGKRPGYAMTSGLARTLSSEQASLDTRTLDLDLDEVSLAQAVRSIVRVARLQQQQGEVSPEREFCVSAGRTYISRLVRHTALNDMFSASSTPSPTTFEPGMHMAGSVRQNKVVFEVLPVEEPELPVGHVELQVQAAGLTREGVLVMTGADYPTTFSHEIGGVVTRVGQGDVSGLEVGDRVIGFHTGRFDTHAIVPTSMLQKLEAADDMAAVVSLLMAYATACYATDVLARLKSSETVLILNGTGANGVAMAHMVTAKGSMPFLVVQTEQEVVYLEKVGIPARQILHMRNGPIMQQLTELTGRGPDVIFSGGSAVNQDEASEAWRGIAPFGRFIDAGRKDVMGRTAIDPTPVVQRGASYMPVDMLHLLEARPRAVSDFMPLILGLHRCGAIAVPGTLDTVDLAHLDAAEAAYSDAFGAKTVVKYDACEVQATSVRRALRFRPDVTYLLVGCLGGLGRSLTSWMMQSGARRFAFLSRSGADAPSAARLVADIEAEGAIVQVLRGDAASRSDVERAVAAVPEANPIRGVVHAAMVLRDAMFHSMTYKDWTTAVAPKVLGAENLHAVLSDTLLDFFLMTSSVSGILGTPGQANYAAANSYLDSLARHRVRAGMAATACVIPMVLGVGVVAENTDIEDSLRRKGMYGIDEEHLLQSFEAGVVADEHADHVVIGLDPALLQRSVADEVATDSFWTEDSRFGHVVHAMRTGSTSDSSAGVSVLAAIKAATSPADAIALIDAHFAEKLARMLMLASDTVDPLVGSIASYGIDSMIGAELRNWIFKEYRIDVPFQQLLSPTLTVDKFARQVVAETLGLGEK